MKINVSVEATPKEMREFLGLPDVQPLQDDLMRTIRDNMQKGVAGFDAMSLLKPLLPPQLYPIEQFQKAFWEAFTSKNNAAQENPAGSDGLPPKN